MLPSDHNRLLRDTLGDPLTLVRANTTRYAVLGLCFAALAVLYPEVGAFAALFALSAFLFLASFSLYVLEVYHVRNRR
jgi:hypothetical protein